MGEPKSKRGDIYLLGRHRLMCGDATVAEDVRLLMDGATADLLLTDPPYNVDYQNHERQMMRYRVNARFTSGNSKIKNDKMNEEQFIQFLTDALCCADAVMRPGAAFYLWYSDLRAYSFHVALRNVGWKLHENLIWSKNRMTLGRYDYHWKHESALYGWKLGADHCWASDRKQTTMLEFASPLRNKIHPTMKPVGLFDYLIKNSSNAGDVVLDLFAGSGTTIMACEDNGRTAYCMECQPVYVDAIVDRYARLDRMDSVYLIRDGATFPYIETDTVHVG